MKNKNVGLLIIGISILVLFIIGIFNYGLKNILEDSCSHGSSCSMYKSLNVQTGISLVITGFIFLIGIFLFFSKPEEKIVVKKIKEKQKKFDMNKLDLDKDEKKVIRLLIQEGKAMFQSDLMEKLEIGKVKTTRLLDKLESKQLIERKRRGMNNIVVLRS